MVKFWYPRYPNLSKFCRDNCESVKVPPSAIINKNYPYPKNNDRDSFATKYFGWQSYHNLFKVKILKFLEEFVRLINCNKTKMKICPSVDAKFNDSSENDGDSDDDDVSNKNISAQNNVMVGNNVSIGTGAKFDELGIVKMTTAFPYEKPVQVCCCFFFLNVGR